MHLRQSTSRVVRVGPFVDVTDGFTPETAVTLTGGGDNADEAEALKAAGAAIVDISAATWAAIAGADGWYDLTLTTSHTDTVGDLTIVIQNDSVHLPVFATFEVIEEAIFDGTYAAGAARVPADATAISGDTVAADNLESACDNYSATRGLTGTALPAAAADAAGGLPISDAGGLDLDAQKADVAAILVDTSTTLDDFIDTEVATIVSGVADIQGRLPAALVGGRIDATIDATGFEDAAVDRVWDEARSGHATQGTYGEALGPGSLVSGTVDTGGFAPTTAEFESDDITEATADHYIGRTVVWVSGSLQGQATDITDYSLSGANGHFTVTAMTEAPANDDKFILV